MRAEGEQLSSLPRHSGQKTIQRGLPKSRCGESARRCIRRGGTVGGMWRRLRGEFPDMTISRVPRAWLPETKFARQKGFRRFPWACWSGDMVSTSPPSFGGDKSSNSTKTEKQWNQGQRVTSPVDIQTSSGDSLNAWMFVHFC